MEGTTAWCLHDWVIMSTYTHAPIKHTYTEMNKLTKITIFILNEKIVQESEATLEHRLKK